MESRKSDWERVGATKLGEGGQSEVYLVRTPGRTKQRSRSFEIINSYAFPNTQTEEMRSRMNREYLEAIQDYTRSDLPTELGAMKEFKLRDDEEQSLRRLQQETAVDQRGQGRGAERRLQRPQPARLRLNLAALPGRPSLPAMAPAGDGEIDLAAQQIAQARSVVIKAGGGTRGHDTAIRRLAEAARAAVALSPGSTGVLPDAHPLNMHVAGSKGSISGNFATANAELVVVIGSRAVCQADCSGIGYKKASRVININGDVNDATHYNQTLALTGDITAVAGRLAAKLEAMGNAARQNKQVWIEACAAKKAEWVAFKRARFQAAPMADTNWQRTCLTQPAAINVVDEFAKRIGAAKLFDAGDVQANGFQIVEDDNTGDTFTETGASYMGFSASGLLASGIADNPRYTIAFCGDGSFMMNPQILIDGIEHGVRGCIVIFDNRRMAAITGLQKAQYGAEFKTGDGVAVDYVRFAGAVAGVNAIHGGHSVDALKRALKTAHAHQGLSVLHVPVYSGDHELAGLGAWGQWNVGNWCEDVQREWTEQDI
jgi:3D-(3,5/4)-trihydroxycyclohexane-1,2-dione acylhydrolase (decyclizing)